MYGGAYDIYVYFNTLVGVKEVRLKTSTGSEIGRLYNDKNVVQFLFRELITKVTIELEIYFDDGTNETSEIPFDFTFEQKFFY